DRDALAVWSDQVLEQRAQRGAVTAAGLSGDEEEPATDRQELLDPRALLLREAELGELAVRARQAADDTQHRALAMQRRGGRDADLELLLLEHERDRALAEAVLAGLEL